MTELGLLPEDWDVRTVRECTDVVTGATPSTTVKEFWGGDIPWMSSGELNKKYIHEVDGRITKKGYENCGTHMIPANCVLIGLAGQGKTRGTAAYNYIPLCTNQSIGSILPKPEFDPLFLYHYFDSQYNQLRLLSAGDGGRGGLNKQLLLNVQFPFPYISEQKKIGHVLTDTDNLISGLEKVIEKKKLIKLGTMQQLLSGRIRLKGFSKPWNEMELGQLVEIKRGSMLKSSEYKFGTIPVIAGGITPAGYHNVANRTGRTITVSASGANAGYVSMHVGPIFATDCSTISEAKDKSYYIDFVYQYLVLHQQDIFRAQTGGAQPHIHPKDISPLKVEVPDYDEQFMIATYLSTMDKEIAALEAERDKYKNIKQGMMQKLLTGQIRLPV